MKIPVFLICCLFITSAMYAADEYIKSRQKMVEQQIMNRGISDSLVLQAMLDVPRHLFVPESMQQHAYRDHPLPIGEDQTISQPYIVALMTSLIALDSTSIVLEIGTGSGYQAAILGEIAHKVISIEIIPSLAERSATLLDSLKYDNITVLNGDGYLGYPDEAPFNGIIVTCAPPEIPQPLIEQLDNNGRMVIPVGTDWQQLLVLTKQENSIQTDTIIPVRFVPMTGEAEEKKK